MTRDDRRRWSPRMSLGVALALSGAGWCALVVLWLAFREFAP